MISETTAKKTAGQDIRNEQQRGGPFVAAAALTRMPMLFTDPTRPENPLIYANDSFLLLSGYSREEVLGRSFRSLIGTDSDPAESPLDTAVLGKEVFDGHADVCYHRKDGSSFWATMLVGPVLGPDGAIKEQFVSLLDVTERRRREQRLRFLLEELNHRTQNTLATVQGIAMQTLRGVIDEATYDAFEGRLLALSETHSLLGRENWDEVSLRAVALKVLEPFGLTDDDHARISAIGEEVLLGAKAAVSLAMMFHELATNATKYGALQGEGNVDLSWRTEASNGGRQLLLSWVEAGGPAVLPPERKSYGSRLIEHVLARNLHGRVDLIYEPTGVICQLLMPLGPSGGEP